MRAGARDDIGHRAMAAISRTDGLLAKEEWFYIVSTGLHNTFACCVMIEGDILLTPSSPPCRFKILVDVAHIVRCDKQSTVV